MVRIKTKIVQRKFKHHCKKCGGGIADNAHDKITCVKCSSKYTTQKRKFL